MMDGARVVVLGLLAGALPSCSPAEPSQAKGSSSAAATATAPAKVEPTCKTAAARYSKSLADLLLGDKVASDVRATASKKIESALAANCEAEKWDPKVIECLTSAQNAVDSEACLEKLSKPTQDKLDEAVARALVELTDEKTAPANSASPSASAVASGAATAEPSSAPRSATSTNPPAPKPKSHEAPGQPSYD